MKVKKVGKVRGSQSGRRREGAGGRVGVEREEGKGKGENAGRDWAHGSCTGAMLAKRLMPPRTARTELPRPISWSVHLPPTIPVNIWIRYGSTARLPASERSMLNRCSRYCGMNEISVYEIP